jgi:aspartate-semialdehyde dehydrogenase
MQLCWSIDTGVDLQPLAGSLLPFIDKMMDDGTGRSKEEWKGNFETNKVLARGAGGKEPVIVDGTVHLLTTFPVQPRPDGGALALTQWFVQCVRVGAMRCHSQAITIKLKRNIPLEEVSSMIASHNQWVQVVRSACLSCGSRCAQPYAWTGCACVCAGSEHETGHCGAADPNGCVWLAYGGSWTHTQDGAGP